MRKGERWKTCGSYFAATETENGKRVLFEFDIGLLKQIVVPFTYTERDPVSVLINRKAVAI